jgi:outer membrane protein insertion porin family
MCTIPGPGRARVTPAGLLLAGVLFLPTPQPGITTGVPLLGDIRFSGLSIIPPADLRAAIPVPHRALLSDSTLGNVVSAVRRFYAQEGYFSTSILPSLVSEPGDSTMADLLLDIREGPQTVIRRVGFRGNSILTAEFLSDLLHTRPGDVPRALKIEEDISSILAAYDAAGHPYARVAVADIVPAEGGGPSPAPAVDILLGIDEGPPVTISEFRVRGNSETNDDVILRESRMELPARYDPGNIARFAERLRRLGLFSSVQDPELYQAGGVDGLLVGVTEGGYNSFDGILGYLPPSPGGEEGRVTGLVNISMRNLFGTGRKVEAEWSRDGGSGQQIRLGYAEPWVFGFPVNLSGRFFQRQQDSTYVDRSLDVEAEFLVSGSLSISGVAGEKRVIPSEREGPPAIRSSTTRTAGIALRYDTRDDRTLPGRGVDYRTEVRAGTKTAAGAASGGSRSVRSLSLDLDVFLPVRRAQVLDLGVHGRQISTDDIERGDLYLLGGIRTLRGFRENRFSGTRVAWGTIEYRLLTGGKSFAFTFLDPGYIFSPLTEPSELITFGYGIGVRLETALGLVGVSLALGKGDPIGETKIHIGLINNF